MASSKETEIPTQGQTGSAPPNIDSGNTSQAQAVLGDNVPSTKAVDLSKAQHIPLPQQDQPESEALDPQVATSAEHTELGPDVLDEAQVTQNPLEAEDNDYTDNDSTFESIGGSSTTSVLSGIYKYREENGRTYHAYKEGKYVLPNDETEKNRLDLQHHICLLTAAGKLHLCPVPSNHQFPRVLDVGTGTGIWAIDFADEHPESQVLGIDLSPIQPTFVPPNCSFEIDDLEEIWNFSYKFDLIHSRMMTGSIADWPRFFAQCYENLNPGGYLYQFELTFPTVADDNSWPEGSALKEWGELIVQGAINIGRSANAAELFLPQLAAAGFEDIKQTRSRWPTNRWPKDAKMKELGMWNYENLCHDVSGLSLGVFTHGLGWSGDQIETYLVNVRKEMKDTRIHAYWPVYMISSRKPL